MRNVKLHRTIILVAAIALGAMATDALAAGRGAAGGGFLEQCSVKATGYEFLEIILSEALGESQNLGLARRG